MSIDMTSCQRVRIQSIMDDTRDPTAEITAMQKIADAFKGLDDSTVARVLRWAVDHWGAKVPTGGQREPPATAATSEATSSIAPHSTFSDLGELFAAVSPETDADKVLVVGYWLQFIEGNNELSGYDVNKELKHLGHGVGNVTTAFDTLKARKPAPVIQLKKSGTSKQARKSYKLTLAGKQAVEATIPRQ